MNHYNNYDIKKFWNHPDAKMIDELDLDIVTIQVLQAVNKWGKVMLYPNKPAGLPAALTKQLGFRPTYEQIIISLDSLARIGYIKPIKKERIPRRGGDAWNLYYTININKIKDQLGSNENALF